MRRNRAAIEPKRMGRRSLLLYAWLRRLRNGAGAMSGPAVAKRGEPTLLAAVRRAVANGMTWSDFVAMCAPEFGAVMREGAIDGWTKPECKTQIKGAR